MPAASIVPEIITGTLADHVRTADDGRVIDAEQRLAEIVELGVATERVGLDGFGVGEHHSPDFVVSSPAVILAAIAARTSRIRLGTAVTVLAANDPVRLQEDFATLDLLSSGRAELTVGRGAFAEPFHLFGVSVDDYDAVFLERLDLLLRMRDRTDLRWQGRFRSPVPGLAVTPYPVQSELPVWIGVGGTPASARRAGTLGLPLMIGSIGMAFDQLAALAQAYRSAGEDARHADALRLGVGLHSYTAANDADARAMYPYYRDFLAPKRAGVEGLRVSRAQYDAGFGRDVAKIIGTSEQVIDKLRRMHRLVRFDRLQILPDWGGMPRDVARASLARFAEEVAPEVRELAG